MGKIFSACADAGDDVIEFLRKDKWHALLIGVLCFISPINLIIWILMVCALYRKRSL